MYSNTSSSDANAVFDAQIYSISRDGALFVWKYILNDEQPEHEQSDQNGVLYKYGRWKLDSKHFFMQQYAKLYSAQFHKKTGLLVVGFDNGYVTHCLRVVVHR